MSALTKALTPWENELSRMLGAADHLIRSPRDGAVLEFVTGLVDEFEGLLDDFDAEVSASVGLVAEQLGGHW